MAVLGAILPVPVLAAFGMWDWGIVLAYFALVIGVGFFVGHKDSGGEKEFFLGGRSMPAWAVSLSLVATMLSAATFVGVPDETYGGDLSYLILNLGGIIAVFFVAYFFVPRLYAAGTVTIYGFLARRFGAGSRTAVSCAFILGRMLSSGARLFVAAIPLRMLLFGDQPVAWWQIALAILLIGAVGTVYATAGGVKAVVWVDVIQFALVVGAALLTIGFLLHWIGKPVPEVIDLLAHAPRSVKDPLGPTKLNLVSLSRNLAEPYTLWTALFGNSFLMGAALGVDHDLAQRFLITKSAFRGSLSMIVSQFISIPVVLLFQVIGLLLYIFYQRPDVMGAVHQASKDGVAIYPHFLVHEMPAGLAGLSIVGFFAIAQGSLDSAMNALAASIVSDIYVPLQKRSGAEGGGGRPSKLTVALVGCGMIALALFCSAIFDSTQSTVLRFVQGLMNYALSGMLAVFLTALFTKRGNTASVIAALLTGAVVVELLQPNVLPWWTDMLFHTPLKLAWPWWTPIGTMAAFAVCVMGKQPLPEETQRGASPGAV